MEVADNVDCWSDLFVLVYTLGEGGSIFLTDDGLIGTTVGQLQPGDRVGIWEGIRAPVVLRKPPGTAEERVWCLVAMAYVEGMMYGEKFREEGLVEFTTV